MSIQLKLRRGTTAQHSTFTGASGEVTVDTDKKTLVVHDGATPGGNALVTKTGAETLTNKTLTNPVINGFTGDASAINIGSGQLVKDTAGNLGLGITPSAWPSTYSQKAFQVGPVGSFSSLYVSAGNHQANLANNAYDFSGAPKYIANGYASYYQQGTGAHTWYIAPSGTAGNPITFTQAMTLDASGNLGIGLTPSVKLEVADIVRATGANATCDANAAGGAASLAFRTTARYWRWITSAGDSSALLNDETSGATRLKVDSAGQFYTKDGAGNVKAAYDCRAWVNFNGTGTVAIRGSGNVSSITDNGTGDYTVNFSTAMSDANYAATCGGILNRNVATSRLEGTNTRTTTQCQVYSSNSGTLTDFITLEYAFFR